MRDVEAMLAEWQQAKVLTEIQAQKVRAYEATRGPEAASISPRGSSLGLISEVLGYLGAVLAASAVAVMLGQTWSSIAIAGQLAIIAALAVVLGGAGLWLHRSTSPPAQRLSSVLMVGGVICVAWFAGVLAADVAEVEYDYEWVVVAATFATFAGVAYGIRRRGLPLVAFLVGSGWITVAVVGEPVLGAPGEWSLFAMAMVGVMWVVLALSGWVVPRAVGLAGGGLMGVLGLQVASFNNARLLMLVIGLVVAGALLSLSVARKGDLALLVPGAVGLLLLLPQLIDELLGDSLLTWLAVLVAGVLLVALSTWVIRDRQKGQPASS
jgi:hypothetical protein